MMLQFLKIWCMHTSVKETKVLKAISVVSVTETTVFKSHISGPLERGMDQTVVQMCCEMKCTFKINLNVELECTLSEK